MNKHVAALLAAGIFCSPYFSGGSNTAKEYRPLRLKGMSAEEMGTAGSRKRKRNKKKNRKNRRKKNDRRRS